MASCSTCGSTETTCSYEDKYFCDTECVELWLASRGHLVTPLVRGYNARECVTEWYDKLPKGKLRVGKRITALEVEVLIASLAEAYARRKDWRSPHNVQPGSSQAQVILIEDTKAYAEAGVCKSVIIVTLGHDETMRASAEGGTTCERIGALFRAMTAIDMPS